MVLQSQTAANKNCLKSNDAMYAQVAELVDALGSGPLYLIPLQPVRPRTVVRFAHGLASRRGSPSLIVLLGIRSDGHCPLGLNRQGAESGHLFVSRGWAPSTQSGS